MHSHAERNFTFNFNSADPDFGDDPLVDVRCNRPNESNAGCGGGMMSWGVDDGSTFLQEYFEVDGELYYHIVVGSPEQGFAQETYTKVGSNVYWGSGGGMMGGGANRPILTSPSKGDGSCGGGMGGMGGGGNFISNCNAGDPLGLKGNDNLFTGNATGNPSRTIMYQVLGGSWDAVTETWECKESDDYCQEFIKDSFEYKPKLTQTINDEEENMLTYFEFDMSNSTYAEKDKVASTINTLIITDPDMPMGMEKEGDFDFAEFTNQANKPGSNSTLTAGMYTFTPGSEDFAGGQDVDANAYDYIDGDFNLDQDWTLYYDPEQNNYGVGGGGNTGGGGMMGGGRR
ncbi:MAG: hypothetical protein L3J70_00405 [Gammaproteobacteria bacterium]|nr:hypothetical protein [Gammaproteobacteria bacterium]